MDLPRRPRPNALERIRSSILPTLKEVPAWHEPDLIAARDRLHHEAEAEQRRQRELPLASTR